MMKNKYTLIKNRLYYEKESIQYLEDMSKNGWQLKAFGFFFFHFIPCDMSLKYQFDYNEFNEEYLMILEEQGYHHIDCCNDIHIYSNKNKNAPDIQTDEKVYQTILLHRYNLATIITKLIFGILAICFGIWSINDTLSKHIALLYLHYDFISLGVIGIFIGLFLLLDSLVIFIKRKSIFKFIYSYQKLRTLDKLKRYYGFLVIFICTIIGLPNLLFQPTRFLFVCLSLFILFFYQYMNRRMIPKIRSSKKRLTIFIISFVVFTFCITVIPSMRDNQSLTSSSLPFQDQVYYTQQNIFIKQVSAFTEETDLFYQQKYYHCLTNKIAKQIFNYEIIETERLSRKPSEEQINQIVEKQGHWSIDDIKAKSYQHAITKYQKLPSLYFEECYYIEDIVVARHKDIVVVLYISDITEYDEVLKNYK